MVLPQLDVWGIKEVLGKCVHSVHAGTPLSSNFAGPLITSSDLSVPKPSLSGKLRLSYLILLTYEVLSSAKVSETQRRPSLLVLFLWGCALQIPAT